ncbi:MAG: peptidoglycan-binding domain-containing protein, partial [Candidatus Colwellbacteria bacterium]
AWVQITNTCSGDYVNPTAPTFPGECAISDGTNTKIVTYHFTTFGSLVATPAPTPTPAPSGGGGSGITTSTPAPTAATTTSPVGQVFGVATFQFTQSLRFGSQGNDVTELQKQLTAEGVYSGPITGYFGPLTQAGIKAYQKKYGIDQVGVVGPLTRAQLNKSAVAGAATSAEAVAIQAKIGELQTQLVALLQKLVEALQAQLK